MTPYNPYFIGPTGTPQLSFTSPGLISPSFTWETVQTLDYGVDFGLLRNRLTGTVDLYQRDTKNILTTAAKPMPAVLGTGTPLQNSGSIRTTGVEIAVNWRDKIGKVGYYFGANVFNSKSVVTSAVNPTNALNYLYVGQKLGDIWGYVSDRLYTVNDFTAPAGGWDAKNYTGGTLNANVPKFSGATPNPGDMLFKKFDTTNQYLSEGAKTLSNPGDRKIIGNSTPKYQFGFNGGVSYANFDFSFVVSGVLKQDLWINNGLTTPNSYQSYSQLYANELNYWTPTNLNAYYGRIYYQNGAQATNNNTVQTRFLQNGAYVRVRNLTLRYTVPSQTLKKLKYVTRLQAFCSAENPFEFDHLPKGVLPDAANQGGANGSGQSYPFLRKTSIGINLSF
jgi:hypothetical protein